MNSKMIDIIIPTLDPARGESVGKLAKASACTAVEVVVVDDSTRTGFSKAINRGIRRARPEADICLLNDDVYCFMHGWLRTLHEALYEYHNIGIVGPSGGSSTSPMRHGKLGQKGLQNVKHLPYWCVVIRRTTINKVGMLDESYIHYASDNQHCDDIRKANLRVVWVKDVWLGHKKHGSGRINKWRKADQALYYGRRRGKR